MHLYVNSTESERQVYKWALWCGQTEDRQESQSQDSRGTGKNQRHGAPGRGRPSEVLGMGREWCTAINCGGNKGGNMSTNRQNKRRPPQHHQGPGDWALHRVSVSQTALLLFPALSFLLSECISFIEVRLIYNGVLVSGVQHSGSVTHAVCVNCYFVSDSLWPHGL